MRCYALNTIVGCNSLAFYSIKPQYYTEVYYFKVLDFIRCNLSHSFGQYFAHVFPKHLNRMVEIIIQ